MGDDDDIPTPKSSGSWLGFRDFALSLADRLDKAHRAMVSSNMLLRDVEGARIAAGLSSRLRAMAADFDAWPGDPQKAARERVPLSSELFELLHKANDLLSAMRGGPW